MTPLKRRIATKLQHPRVQGRQYGWKRDLPDRRDHVFLPSVTEPKALPREVDLTSKCPPVYDQGRLGSCTSNAICAAYLFEYMKQNGRSLELSRLFHYFNERKMEGTVDFDSGASIRDGIKTAVSQGICRESSWLYDIRKFKKVPPSKCYDEALNYQVLSYMRLSQILYDLKACLAAGSPFVFGFSVYESFETNEVTRTGKAPMPAANERLLGGHATMAVGYSDTDQRFIVRNSWSLKWGKQGNFTLPYAYLTSPGLAADFWTIHLVETGTKGTR